MLYRDYLKDKYQSACRLEIAEGVPCVLEYSKGKNIRNYEIHGNSIQGRNLLPYPYYHTTRTTNGITFTDNGDGSVTVNGTATANAIFYFYSDTKNLIKGLKIGDSITVSIVSDKTWVSSPLTMNIVCNYYDLNTTMKDGNCIINSTTKYKTITIGDNWVGIGMYIVVYKNQTVDNITLRAQIELGVIATDWQSPIISPDTPIIIQSVGDLTTKNLLPYPYYYNSRTLNGITFAIYDGGTIILNGTGEFDTERIKDFILLRKSDISAGTYTLSGCPTGGGVYSYRLFVTVYNYYSDGSPKYYNDIGRGTSIDVKENCRITISIRFGDEIGTVNNLVFKPQLEEGSTATEYEPYHKYAIPIIVTGKNLFNISDFAEFYTPYWAYPPEYGYHNEVNEKCLKVYASINADGRALVYMENSFKENTAYTFSLDCYDVFGSNGIYGITISLRYTDGVKQSLLIDKREDKVWKHYSITSNPDKTVQGITVSYGTGMAYSYLKNIQIEEASTENFYEPYITPVQTDIYLDEPLRKVGEYADYIDFKGQRVVRKVGVSDNTGTKPISESLGVLAIPTEEPIPLPALKTFKGTSIISVDTSVQPSNIKAKYVRL